MRGCLVSGLGLLLGLVAAWAGDGDAAAPAPSTRPASSAGSGPSTQPAASVPAGAQGKPPTRYVGHQVAVWTFDKKTHALVGFAKGEVAPGGRAVLESVKGHAITFTLGRVKQEQVSDEPGAKGRKDAALTRKIEQFVDAPVLITMPATQPAGKAGAVRELKPGEAAPDFTAKTLDGKDTRLSDYRGKFVLLEFWATWCGPCVTEAPHLKAVHDAFGRNERFVMVSLSLDEDIESPRKFVKEAGLGWVQGFLGAWRKTDIPDEYGVRGIPGIFLVGPDGKIVATGIRGRNLKIVVAKALGEPIPQPTLTDDERIRLEQAQSMVDLCRAELNRLQEDAKRQGASEKDVAQARLALKRAELALQVVQCHTRDDQAGINRIQEEASQLQLEVARVYLKSMVTKIHLGEILNRTYPRKYDSEINRLFREVLTVLPEQVVFDHEFMRHLNVDAIEAAVDPQLNGPDTDLPDLPQTRAFRQQVNDAYRQQLRKARAEYVTGLRRSAADSWLQTQHVHGSPEETWRRRAAIGKEFPNDAEVQAALNALMPGDAERARTEASGTASTQPAPNGAGTRQAPGKTPSTQPATQPARPKGATITGRVVDKPGGKPVAGATVTLVGDKGTFADSVPVATAVTDADGKYVFRDVPHVGFDQKLHVGRRAPGEWAGEIIVYVPREAARTGQTIAAADLYANPTCTVSGTVRDAETGKGVPNAVVMVRAPGERYSFLEADDQGRCRLRVFPGEVEIACGGTCDRYLPDNQEPRKIALKAGQAVKEVDFTITSAPAFSGRVVMPDGTPPANMPVLVMVDWSNAFSQHEKRIAEARVRREERIKAGKQAPPPQKRMQKAAEAWDSCFFTKRLPLKTDADGRVAGYLRLPGIELEPVLLDVDFALDLVFVVRTGDERQAALKIIQTTTIDPPPQPVEIKLAQSAAAEFVVCNPDGVALADAKAGAFSWLFDYYNMGDSVPEAAPDFVNLGSGRYRAAGLVPQWDYRIHADANGCKCRSELKVIAKPGQTVDAGVLMLDWWGPKAVPGLIEKLSDKDWPVRQHTCYELAALGPVSAPAVDSLIALLSSDSDHTVRCAAAEALGKIGPAAKPAVPHLIGALENDGFGVPTKTAAALGCIGDPAAIDALRFALVHAGYDTRATAAAALDKPAFIAADANVPALLKLARSREGYQGPDLVLAALGPDANLRIARMIHQLASRQDASQTTRHILGILIGRPYEKDKAGNVTPKTVLAWWWTFPLDDRVPPRARLDEAAMAKLWNSLADEDPAAGYQAALTLASGGDDVAAFLAGKLKPPAAGSDEIAALIARLGDDKAAARDQATAQLALIGRPAEAALKAALAGNLSAEVRIRLAMLLDALSQPYPAVGSTRQAARALRVLEMIDTPAAGKLLAALAKSKGDDFLSALARRRAAFRARSGKAVDTGTPKAGDPPATAFPPSAGSGQASDRGATRLGDSGKP